MTFLNVLEAAKRRRTGVFGFWGKIFRFARIFTPLTCKSRKVLQGDDSAVLSELFRIFPERIWGDNFPPPRTPMLPKYLVVLKIF